MVKRLFFLFIVVYILWSAKRILQPKTISFEALKLHTKLLYKKNLYTYAKYKVYHIEMDETKCGFFSESAIRFSNLKISKKNFFQKTILNLKFKFPTKNTLLLLAGNLNFKFRIVFSEKKPPLVRKVFKFSLDKKKIIATNIWNILQIQKRIV